MAAKCKSIRSSKIQVYLVWETEYAEEGSWEIRATSLGEAKKKFRIETGEPDTQLAGCKLTPALRRLRRESSSL
jgi:hypothetical protein